MVIKNGILDSKENKGFKLATEEEKPLSSQRGKVTLKIYNKPTDGWIQNMIPRRRPILKGNCTIADLRYGEKDIISPSTQIFDPVKG